MIKHMHRHAWNWVRFIYIDDIMNKQPDIVSWLFKSVLSSILVIRNNAQGFWLSLWELLQALSKSKKFKKDTGLLSNIDMLMF